MKTRSRLSFLLLALFSLVSCGTPQEMANLSQSVPSLPETQSSLSEEQPSSSKEQQSSSPVASSSEKKEWNLTISLIGAENNEIFLGKENGVYAIAKADGVETREVTWQSSNEDIVRVNSIGFVYGVAVGNAEIYATSTIDSSKTATLYVTVRSVPVQLPLEGDFSESTIRSASIPAGWSAANNEAYSGGLKASYDGYWVLSHEFTPTSKGVDVAITVPKLNAAQGEGAGDYEAVFLVEAFDSVKSDATRVYANCVLGLEVKKPGIFTTRLHGENICIVKIALNKRPMIDGAPHNVNISKIALFEGDDVPGQSVDYSSLKLNKSKLELLVGREEELVTYIESSSDRPNLIWTTSNQRVATVDDGKVTAIAEGTATIRVTVDGNPNAHAECTVTVVQDPVNYGTEAAPICVADARVIINALGEGNTTPIKMTVKGVVTRFEKQYAFWIKDEETDKEIEIYYFDVPEGIASPAVNDVVVVKGWGKKYVDNDSTIYLELTGGREDYPKILSNTRGASAVTLGAHEHATVMGLPEGGTAINGTTVSFTITPDKGYLIHKVKLNGQEISENEGVYTFVLAGPAEIIVITKDTNDPSKELVLDFATGPRWAQNLSTEADILVEREGFGMIFNTINAYTTALGGYLTLSSRNRNKAATFANKTEINGAITKVEFTTTDTASVASEFTFALDTSQFQDEITSGATYTGNGTFEISAEESDGFNYFGISCTGKETSSSIGRIAKIVITYIPYAS